MCATCFAQASVYVGGALGGLQIMAGRIKAKRLAAEEPEGEAQAEPAGAGQPGRLASAT